jgi:uncharacterized membrane protein
MISLRHLRSRAAQTFWLIPTGCVSAAIVLGVLLPNVHLPANALLFGSGPESARSFLSSITTAMITMTGLVFSLTVVALQLAAGQFSSRVMRDFLRDRVIQVTFGVFVATFTYALILQRSVRGVSSSGPTVVPQLGISAAFLLVLASVALFVVYINRIANSIRIANIVTRIGARTRATIEQRYPTEADTATPTPAPPERPPTRFIPTQRAAVVVSLNEQALITLAAEQDCVLVLLPRIGDYIPQNSPLFAQHGGPPCADAIRRHVSFDTERTYEQDAAFGFRELVDIAERALSPAVNDPTTAAQAIDIAHDLLRDVATRPRPQSHHLDRNGALRLVTRRYDFPDLLELTVEEIAHYGTHDLQTPRRLRAMLNDLTTIARPEYAADIDRWLNAISPR